ncbi:histidine kinase [Pedobacter sp. N36a]|uniref:sensor histidine kinase n=1 Tax=Pedobacter sp. N36a TaxID=2767996 RepID=UPI0016570487|nr:histidine kinase [Pedobacter sp. N36a]MBC8985167.1 histidine kinase [Pedobacter sp. N36a]
MKIILSEFINFIRKYKIHFIGWSIFIFYEVVIMGLIRKQFSPVGNYVFFYIFNILLFYFHAHFVMPGAKMKTVQALWRLPLLILIEVVVYICITANLANFFHRNGYITFLSPPQFSLDGYIGMSYRVIYFILFSSAYYYILGYFEERKRAEEKEKERLLVIIENQRIYADLIKSQHAHLKAQINPHFLFNTLNFIYTSTRKTTPEAAEAILALSEMMRYSIEEVSNTNSPLIGELEQVENLIKLHKIKSHQELYIQMEYDEEVAELEIVPLLVMTLVENMFKHGDLLQQAHPAQLQLKYKNAVLKIETTNLISKNQMQPSHHIGLDNVKKRLKAAYGDQAVLHTLQQEQQFKVSLEICLSPVN